MKQKNSINYKLNDTRNNYRKYYQRQLRENAQENECFLLGMNAYRVVGESAYKNRFNDNNIVYCINYSNYNENFYDCADLSGYLLQRALKTDERH